MMKCNIYEKERETKCFRRWEYGHVKVNCKGEDREKTCARCAKEGHAAIT